MAVKIADPLLMREINKDHVLETIRCHGQISRVEISERTLLSGTTVSAITAALIEEGLIEAIHTAPTNDSQRGRPRVLLGLVADGVERGGRQPGAQGVAVHDVLEPGGAKAGRHGS